MQMKLSVIRSKNTQKICFIHQFSLIYKTHLCFARSVKWTKNLKHRHNKLHSKLDANNSNSNKHIQMMKVIHVAFHILLQFRSHFEMYAATFGVSNNTLATLCCDNLIFTKKKTLSSNNRWWLFFSTHQKFNRIMTTDIQKYFKFAKRKKIYKTFKIWLLRL